MKININKLLINISLSFIISFFIMIIVCALLNPVYVTNVGIVTEENIKSTPDYLDWGFIDVNITATKTVTLENIGNKDVHGLNMTIGSVYGITDYDITWNLEQNSLLIGETKEATFTLTVRNYTDTDFTFLIIISSVD